MIRPGDAEWDEWEELNPEADLMRFSKYVGLTATGWSPGRCQMECEITDDLLNRNDVLHGGVALTAMDVVMGFAAFYRGEGRKRRVGATLSLTTQFQKSVASGRLTTLAWVTGGGRKTFFVASEIRNSDGEVCFLGNGVFKAFSNPDAD